MNGFNPRELVARGVFDSLTELDAVMCELDDVRPGPTVTRQGWSNGMDFVVGVSRLTEAEPRNAGSNLVARAQGGVTPAPSRISVASSTEASARKVQFPKPTTSLTRARTSSGAAMAHDPASEPMGVPPAPNRDVVWGRQPGEPVALCVFCAMERALQPGPRMARPQFNGDVMLWPCARHADLPQTSTPQPAVSQEHRAGISRPAA